MTRGHKKADERIKLVPPKTPPKPCTLLWFALVAEDDCPACLGVLDTYYVCRDCRYNASPYIDLEHADG